MFVGYGRRAADKNQIPLPGGHARVRTRQRSAKALRKAGRTALVVCNAPYARVLRLILCENQRYGLWSMNHARHGCCGQWTTARAFHFLIV